MSPHPLRAAERQPRPLRRALLRYVDGREVPMHVPAHDVITVLDCKRRWAVDPHDMDGPPPEGVVYRRTMRLVGWLNHTIAIYEEVVQDHLARMLEPE